MKLRNRVCFAKKMKSKKKDSSTLALVAKDRSASSAQAVLAVHRSGKGAWFSSRSFIALGVRRKLSNIASKDLGPLCLTDVSRHTVTRAELAAAAALQLACRARIAASSSYQLTEIQCAHVFEDRLIVSIPQPLMPGQTASARPAPYYRIVWCSCRPVKISQPVL